MDQKHFKRGCIVPISITADPRFVHNGWKITALLVCGRSLSKGPRSWKSYIREINGAAEK